MKEEYIEKVLAETKNKKGVLEEIIKDQEVNVTDDGLQTISVLAEAQLELEEGIEEKQNELKVLKEKHRRISEEQLPDALMEVGVSEFKLKDGTKISTATYYSARITPDTKEDAFSWLRGNNFADLIKNTVSVSFGRDEDEIAQILLNELNGQGLNTTQKEWVEPMTLKAFVREQVEKGADLPHNTFNIFIGQRTKIKR
jgi:16S rRNA C1402 N4-methylase RsmH